jgi:hypothetical protein
MYLKTLFYNNSINNKAILKVLLVLSILFVLIFHLAKHICDNISEFDEMNGICVIGCGDSKIKKCIVENCKGDDYLLTAGKYEMDCFMSIWELTHVYLHIFIGYYLDMRYSLVIGTGFEFYEYSAYKCHNWMDIFWNITGATIGGTCRYIQNL